MIARPGGALLLARFIALATGKEVRTCRLENLESIPPEEIIHSLVELDRFPSFEGKIGWLKYFLAPMQDGAFKDGETMHPLGRAIFVFAGGTSSTFAEFAGGNPDDHTPSHDFKDAKGPDFVSRLRGSVQPERQKARGRSGHAPMGGNLRIT